MADGSPPPEDVTARARASAPAAQGEMDRICLPCRGLMRVEASYTDRWCTPLTGAPVRIEDFDGLVCDGSEQTEPLAAHGLQDGDAPTAPLVSMGSTREFEVAQGGATASLVPQGGGEADAGMDALGAALTAFRDSALGQLQPYVAEWGASGLLSIPEAQARGFAAGLSSWYKSETDFWGGVSDFAVQQYQAAEDWLNRQSPEEQFLFRNGGMVGKAAVAGLSLAEWWAEQIREFFVGVESLAEFAPVIMQTVRDFASGTVDVMQAALDRLRDLPGELGQLIGQVIDTGQVWKERLVLIASETNAFENIFHVIMTVVMNMTPNFWAEMYGTLGGFIIPEVIIEIILAAVAALTGGSTAPLIGARLGAFILKLRGLSRKLRSINILADILEAFGKAISALQKIGKGLHDEISATARSAADGIARIRHRVQQYKLEVDPNTLGMNGGNIRIVRKRGREAHYTRRGIRKSNIAVEADFQMGGDRFFDVNQTARNPEFDDLSRPTAIQDDIKPRNGRLVPNRVYGEAHAEIGAMQQAYESGLRGGKARLNVSGQEVCPYCLSDIKKMANRLELEELIVIDPSGSRRWDPISNKLQPM